MKRFKLFVLITLITLGLFTSCNQDDIDENSVLSSSEFDSQVSPREEGDFKYTVLGKKKEIPCSVENMASAYESLLRNPTAKRHPSGNYSINKTHLYVKFKPQDSIQNDKILNDTILAVSDEPFEYEVVNKGSVYLDPEATDTTLTFYYSVVSKDHQISGEIPHEILKDLHFTAEDAIGETPTDNEEQILDFYEGLNTEALKISDNLEEDEKKNHTYFISDPEERLTYDDIKRLGLKVRDVQINYDLEIDEVENGDQGRLFGRKWRPSGTITVQEDAIDQSVGVMGARVRVRKWGWLVIRKAPTNRTGYFETSRTRTKRVKYACYFKHDPYFVVKAGTTFWNARDRSHSTHTRRSWRRHYSSGRNQFYAFIQNGAYDYYTRVIYDYNLSHPGFFKKIVGKMWYNTSSHALSNLASAFAFYNVRITIGSGGSYRGSDGIYATTVHELTHLGHRNMDSGMFSIFHSGSNNRKLLTESWAEGVETIVTNDRYDDLINNYQSSQNGGGRWNSFRQRQTEMNMNQYTPIVDDLIDNLNQNTTNFARPVDRVENYTLNRIQSALDNCRDIECWENKLNNNRPAGVTTAELNELFDYVRAVRNNAANW
ncbi:hypothetical protein LX95_01860 [Mesonia algae]|uniref:Uncharacterized protein n=1 Tax=Mesonia algae TaxID=213248 RepID=A0A2W7I5N9_9FLAO|nr:hypothetical protein [Mesonia algae]PZW40792.1 hypothetical protein LX95_01860 [Mesonia algae]